MWQWLNTRKDICQPFYVLQQTEDMSGSSIIVIVYNIYTRKTVDNITANTKLQ